MPAKPETQPPKPKLTPFEATLELARRGNEAVLPKLRELLSEHSDVVEHFGNLARIAEQALINRVAGTDLRVREALMLKSQKMRTELSGENASAVERVLVDRLVISWLAVHEAELNDAPAGGDRIRLAEFHMKRLDAAHRRVLSAAKTLATVRRLVGGLRVEIHHHGDEDATGRAGPGPSRQQLREAMAAQSEIDRELVEEAV